jgi:hypothetical protein
VLNKLFGVPSINFGDENIYFDATTILFGGALNGCQKKNCWFPVTRSTLKLNPPTQRNFFLFLFFQKKKRCRGADDGRSITLPD